jgi:methionyl-tRNA formyltransferase
MVEAVDMVRDGAAPRTVQDESQATYEGWCRPEDVIIDWGRTLGEIYNLIRGSDPSPGAGTTYKGGKIRFYGTERRQDVTGSRPGKVTEVSDHGFAVAAQGGSLLVRRVQPSGERKVSASEWAAATGLTVGDRFGA